MRFLFDVFVENTWVIIAVEHKRRVAGRSHKYINCYIHWLIVYHFRKPVDDDEDQIVTVALSIMSDIESNGRSS